MKLLAVALMAGWTLAQAGAADIKWSTDVPQGVTKAKAENKLVMLDFTGSDWCGWCIKLNKEIFSQPEFVEYAQKNIVAVELDFPRKKEQTAELKKANKELQKKYKIEGYPTIIVLNGEGKEIGRLGYMEGGPKAFIKELEKLKKKA